MSNHIAVARRSRESRQRVLTGKGLLMKSRGVSLGFPFLLRALFAGGCCVTFCEGAEVAGWCFMSLDSGVC